jgi:hypothetical protein
MLIRRKSSTDDEYHHEDLLGVFGVVTGENGAVLSSNVYDAFMGMQYVQGVSKTTQPATCFKAMSEPGILTGSGGRGVVVPSRGFQVLGKKPTPVKKQPCKKKAPGSGNNGDGHTPWWWNCAGRAGFWGGVGMFGGAGGLTLDASCLLCLGLAAVGCGVNPIVFCAPLVDSCAEYCGEGVLKTLVGWLAGYLGAFIECIARHEGIKWV